MQPNKLETLDDLLAQAEHYAGFCMRNSGKMSPTLFLIGADGPLMFVPASLVDANEKNAFANTARLVCIAHAATVCVMVLEAWMKTATPGEKMDKARQPLHGLGLLNNLMLLAALGKGWFLACREHRKANCQSQQKTRNKRRLGGLLNYYYREAAG